MQRFRIRYNLFGETSRNRIVQADDELSARIKLMLEDSDITVEAVMPIHDENDERPGTRNWNAIDENAFREGDPLRYAAYLEGATNGVLQKMGASRQAMSVFFRGKQKRRVAGGSAAAKRRRSYVPVG